MNARPSLVDTVVGDIAEAHRLGLLAFHFAAGAEALYALSLAHARSSHIDTYLYLFASVYAPSSRQPALRVFGAAVYPDLIPQARPSAIEQQRQALNMSAIGERCFGNGPR